MIRFAQADDLPDICRIRRQVHKVHTKGRPDIYREPEDSAEFDQLLLDTISQDNYQLMVYETTSGIAGYALIRLVTIKDNCMKQDRFSYFIEEFGVDESCRRQGIGTALMHAILEQARDHHAAAVELDVWAFNENAESFYRSLGMKTKHTYLEFSLG